MIRSTVAVMAGIVVLVMTSFAIEAAANPIMKSSGLFPDDQPTVTVRLVTMAYTSVCIAAGGYVAAWIAGRYPVLHALIMGVVQVELTVLLIFSQPDLVPPWAWIVTVVMIVPAAWCGGVVRAWQTKRLASVAPS
jgi:hypothetical protein